MNTQSLMERLNPWQRRFLTKRLFRWNDSYEAAAKALLDKYGIAAAASELSAYANAVAAKREAELATSERRRKAREARRQAFLAAQPAPQPRYVPQPEESPLRVQVTQLAEELAYYKGFAAAARLFAQPTPKGAQ
jgi:hypothetical protein